MDRARANRLATELMGQAVGGWRLTGFHSFGKSAIVFRGSRDDVIAAVKVFDPELVERFGSNVQEQRISRELLLKGKEHPHLVSILDGGRCPETGFLFVTMNFVEGPNLAGVLSDVPRDRIWSIISQVANAARFLEEVELVHRDIKPDNISISLDFSHAKLLDLGVIRPFGIADLTDEEQRVFVGTLQYSSPEFLFRKEEDSVEGWRALTYYQLGAVLYDLIMRKRIFAEFVEPYARLVQAVEYERPSVIAPDVTPDLILLTKNCLTKDPKLRLRLVSWTDFEVPQSRVIPAMQAKERIRKRRERAQHEHQVSPDTWSEQRGRETQRTLEKVQAKLEDLVRRECIGSDLFPPVQIHSSSEAISNRAQFVFHFNSSLEYDLSQSLSLWFEVKLVDVQAEVIQLNFAAAVGSDRPDSLMATNPSSYQIFEGVFEPAILEQQVQNVLYSSLDKAQQYVDDAELTDSKQISWIEVPLTDD